MWQRERQSRVRGTLTVSGREILMNAQDWGVESSDQYWYNTRTGEIETGKQSLSIDRVGPFETREQAARAPEIIAERARRWAEEEAAEE